MTTLQYDAVADAVDAAGLEQSAIYPDYSGRGMFGRECFGLTVNNVGQAIAFAIELAREDEELDSYDLSQTSQDSMGLSMIVYWPNITLEGVPA